MFHAFLKARLNRSMDAFAQLDLNTQSEEDRYSCCHVGCTTLWGCRGSWSEVLFGQIHNQLNRKSLTFSDPAVGPHRLLSAYFYFRGRRGSERACLQHVPAFAPRGLFMLFPPRLLSLPTLSPSPKPVSRLFCDEFPETVACAPTVDDASSVHCGPFWAMQTHCSRRLPLTLCGIGSRPRRWRRFVEVYVLTTIVSIKRCFFLPQDKWTVS